MASPLSPRDNPHIRLNSNTSDMLDESSAQRPSTARQNSARSLTQPIRPGTAPSPASPGLRSPSVPSLYKNDNVAASAEHLLPPKKSRIRPFRDESPAAPLSRRESWESDSAASRDSRYSPFASPFDDSRAPSRAGSEDDLNTQTVSEKFNITPSAGLLLFPEDVEKDDWLHNPDPNEKNERDCDVFTKRGIVNVGALVILTLGLLVLFIGYPILYVLRKAAQRTGLTCSRTFVHNITAPEKTPCSNNPLCIAGKEHEPLLKNIRTGLIDPHTPDEAKTRKSHNGKIQKLVFSDEFNEEGRTFYDGDDPYFQAADIWYGATQDLEVSLCASKLSPSFLPFSVVRT
jgi:hypothetical protein